MNRSAFDVICLSCAAIIMFITGMFASQNGVIYTTFFAVIGSVIMYVPLIDFDENE